jgi:hypothetical protein
MPKLTRHRTRFSLKSTLLVMLVLCFVLAVVSSARRQRLAVRALQAKGAFVCYDEGVVSTWLTARCPASLDYVRSPRWLFFTGRSVSNQDLRLVRELGSLVVINLAHTNVSDDAVVVLSGVTSLRLLDLTGTQVTDAAIRRLRRALPDCHIHHSLR